LSAISPYSPGFVATVKVPAYFKSPLISSTDSTFPADLTSPSTASPGVTITPKPMMSLMFVTFSISNPAPSSVAAARALS